MRTTNEAYAKSRCGNGTDLTATKNPPGTVLDQGPTGYNTHAAAISPKLQHKSVADLTSASAIAHTSPKEVEDPAFAAAETRRSRSIVLFPQQQQQRKSCVASKDVQKWETSQVRNMRRRQYCAKYNARIAKIPTLSDASGKSNLPGRRLTF